MPYPVLAPNSTWYKGSMSRNTITQINIVDSYSPTGSETASWNADAENTGSIKCYVTGNVLTIAGNGSGKIYANPDSSYAFGYLASDGFSSLTTINGADKLDTSKTTNMHAMFGEYISSAKGALVSIDVSNWDVSNVTNMKSMFSAQVVLPYLDVSKWDTSSCTDMYGMFNSCNALTELNVSNFNTSKVTNMYAMFQNCKSLTELDVSKWDTSSCVDMTALFVSCSSVQTLDVSNWDVSNVTNMYGIFYNCTSLTTLDVSNWDVSNVTNMYGIFKNCTSLTELDVSNWDISNVTNMSNMFSGGNYNASPMVVKELDVSNWDTSSCTDMSFMFYNCKGPKTINVSSWDVSKVTNFDHMFAHSNLIVNGVENWAPSTACINMNAMFHTASNTSIDVSKFDTSNVQFFNQMFEYMSKLVTIKGLENFNTSNGLGFEEMFNDCRKLKELDLSSFDTSKAKDGVKASNNGHLTATMKDMFNACTSLEKITVGSKFTFKGDGTTTNVNNYAVLPAPSSDYISGADGNWYTRYRTPVATIPDNVAETYYASIDLANNVDFLIKNGTLMDIADAIRTKTFNDIRYAPTQIAGIISFLDGASTEVIDAVLDDIIDIQNGYINGGGTT